MKKAFTFSVIFLVYTFQLWISGGYSQRDENTYNSIAFNIAEFDQYNTSRGVDINDMSKNYFWPRVLQAPGYFILLGHVQKLIENSFLAIVLYYGVLHLLLFTALYQIIKMIAPDFRWRYFHLPFIVFFPPVLYGNGNDFTSTVFFFTGVFLLMKLIQNRRLSILWSLPVALVIFVCAFSRYAYYPLIFVIPAGIYFTGLIKNSLRLRKTGLFTGTVLLVLIGAQHLILSRILGQGLFLTTAYAIPDDRTFYWENLLRFDPFPIKSLFYLGQTVDYLNYDLWWRVVMVISSMIILWMIVVFFKTRNWFGLTTLVRSNIRTEASELQIFFNITGMLLLILNITMLLYLSLSQPHQPLYGFWTYVLATRYYMPNMIFIAVWILVLIPTEQSMPSGVKKISRALRPIALAGAVIITTAVFYDKVTGFFLKENRSRQNIEVYNYARELINQGETVLYSEESAYNVYFVTLSGAIPFYKPASYQNDLQWKNYFYDLIYNNIQFRHSSPLTLLIKLNSNRFEQARTFLETHQAKEIITFGHAKLYEINLE